MPGLSQQGRIVQRRSGVGRAPGVKTRFFASDNYWTFTGEQTDEESGFSYLRARYYDPEVGRFLSNDPLGGGYPYAGNNPVGATDPSGLASCAGVSGAYSISTDSSGNTACYDESGQILTCTGVCAIDFNSPLSSPVTITEEELAIELLTKGAPLDDASNVVLVDTDPGIIRAHAKKPDTNNGAAVVFEVETNVIGKLSQGYLIVAFLEAQIIGAWIPIGTTEPVPCHPTGGCTAQGVAPASPLDAFPLRTGFYIHCPSCNFAFPWAAFDVVPGLGGGLIYKGHSALTIPY